jgi:CMP-N-acetylneuraminic acid synthetase
MCEALTIAVKSIETLSNIINIMENTSPYEVESEIENALENFKEYVEAE